MSAEIIHTLFFTVILAMLVYALVQLWRGNLKGCFTPPYYEIVQNTIITIGIVAVIIIILVKVMPDIWGVHV